MKIRSDIKCSRLGVTLAEPAPEKRRATIIDYHGWECKTWHKNTAMEQVPSSIITEDARAEKSW